MKAKMKLINEIREPGHPFGNFFNEHNEKLKDSKFFNVRQKQKLNVVDSIRKDGFYTFQQAFDSKSGPLVTIDDVQYKLLSSYDYLGLIGHKGLEAAAVEAIYKYGTGTGGVRLLAGTNKLHFKLENELALFMGTEAALTYSSGYQANLALLSTLLDSKDMVIVDSKIHHSTLDACKLAGVSFRKFEHNNMDSLERLLTLYCPNRRVLVISEGIFSMDGDICNLPELIKLKKKYGAFLMIDEAHSLGVLGENGRGVSSHFNICPNEVDIYTGSLSKAIPASGGFVSGSKELIILLQHYSSPFIFSAALGPAATAAALMTLQVFQSESEKKIKLWENTKYFITELKNAGFNTGLSSSPIIPVILGSNECTLSFSRKLFDHGILATPVLFPAVPKNESRLRICITAAHERHYLQEVLEIFKKLR